jgi:hypothetical protein
MAGLHVLGLVAGRDMKVRLGEVSARIDGSRAFASFQFFVSAASENSK